MDEKAVPKRRPFLAAFLSLFGPVGQLYAGRGKRFIVFFVARCLLAPLAAFLMVRMPENAAAFNGLVLLILCFPVFLAVDAFQCARNSQAVSLVWYQRWWIYPIAVVSIFISDTFVLQHATTRIAEAFVIPTDSMAPTIMAGDRILVSKIEGGPESMEYGDVVVFYTDGPNSPQYVMRVVAFGGDSVEMSDESLYVNDRIVDEPYADFTGILSPYDDFAEMERRLVPEDHFFVLGDRRRRSMDSRFIGSIAVSDYVGKAKRIFWSRPRKFKNPWRQQEYTTDSIAWERIGKAIK